MGYAPNAYRLWCEESEKIIVSSDVVFTNRLKHKQNSDGTKSVKIPIFVSDDDESKTIAEDEEGEVNEDTSGSEENEDEENESEENEEESKTVTRAGREINPPDWYGNPIPSDCLDLT